MNKSELKEFIELYKKTEKIVLDLNRKYGVNLIDSPKSNFYNNYNYLIHKLLVEIFGDNNTEVIEDFIFGQVDNIITIEDLCKVLRIE